MARKRLTRAEQKERTRKRLLKAAMKVLAKRGYHAASVEEVAEQAGLTRGAVYSNFKDKEDLFFACFDEVLRERMPVLAQAAQASPEGGPQQVVQDVGDLFGFFMGERLEWFLVFVEFLSQAAKSSDLRRRIAPRLAEMRDAVAGMIEAQSKQLGMPLPAAAEVLAAAAISLSEGFALRRLVAPEAFPQELHQSMLGLFFQGIVSLSKEAGEAKAGPNDE